MKGKDGITCWYKQCFDSSFQSTAYFEPAFTPVTESLNSIDEYFDYFIDEFVLNQILFSTNKRINETKKINLSELKGFIGLLLLFGVTKKHDIEIAEIFKVGSVNHMDWATICMSRERFQLISINICFDDVDTRSARFSNNPKLHKINEVFDHFRNKLQKGINNYIRILQNRIKLNFSYSQV